MRICLASMWYPPFFIGGAGIYAEYLSRELAKLGHEIHVITPRFGLQEPEIIENGVIVHRIPVIRKPLLWIPCYWLNLRAYHRELQKRLGFDVLHGNVNSDLSLAENSIGESRVVTIHHLGRTTFENMNPSFAELLRNPSGELGLGSWIEKNTLDFDRIVTARARKIITVSQFCKQEIITKYGIQPSKISVIYNGVYPEHYVHSENEVEAMRSRISDASDFLALFVGRLERRKGLPLLIEAFKLVSQKLNARLIIVGAGKQEPFRQIAHSLGIDSRVSFLGFVDNLTLRRIYSACDLLVSSSYLEGFGITLLEAMASEKPVVALNVGGIGEIVKDGINGRLVRNRNHEELAKAILQFAENPELSKSIGRQNREYVKQEFSWDKNAKLTEQLYESLACA